MNELILYSRLNEAYKATTRNRNAFAEAINSVAWDKTFEADEQDYYCKEGFILMVENINPLKERWKPSVFLSNSSYIELGKEIRHEKFKQKGARSSPQRIPDRDKS